MNIPVLNIGGQDYNVKDTEARNKIDDLKSAIIDDVAPRANASFNALGLMDLISDTTWTYGYCFDGSTGEPVQNQYTTDYSISDYIEVTPPIHLLWACGANSTCAVVAYDSNKNIVEKFMTSVSQHLKPSECFIIDSSVAYIRYQRLPNNVYKHSKQYLYDLGDVNFNANGALGVLGAKSLLEKNGFSVLGHSLSYIDGTESASQYTPQWRCTDYIEINPPCKICWGFGLIYANDKMVAVCTYDENKNYIHSYFTVGSEDGPGEVIEYNENVKYIRYNIVPESSCSKEKQYLIVQELSPESSIEFFASLLNLGNVIHKYIFNGEELEPGQYTQGYYCTDYIEIPSKCTIEWRAGNTIPATTLEAVAFYDENHNWLFSAWSTGGYGLHPGKVSIDDARVKYVRYNITPTRDVPWGGQYLNCYINSSEEIERKVDNLINAGDVRVSVVLSKDGTGDFTTWRAATEYCWTHPNTDVYVHRGTYDLVEEYGDTYFDNIPADYDRQHTIGPECGYNCRYIFSAGAKLVFHYTGSNARVSTFFSPVNIIGSCEFHNMTIEASNCRYCVHEDMPCVILPIPEDVRVKYVNCHMTHEGNTLGDYRTTFCIGAGGGINSVSEVDGGEYISDVGSISYHLPSSTVDGCCEAWIHDAYCTGVVQATDYPDSYTGTLYFYVHGCSLSSNVITGVKTVARIYGNEIRSE